MDISLSMAISYLQESSQRLKNGWIWLDLYGSNLEKDTKIGKQNSMSIIDLQGPTDELMILTGLDYDIRIYTHTPSNVQMKPKQQRLIFCRYISAHIGLWCSISTTPHPPNQPSVSENRIPSLAPFHPILSHTFCSPSIPKLDLQFHVW